MVTVSAVGDTVTPRLPPAAEGVSCTWAAGPSPGVEPFTARTSNVYLLPFAKPVTVWVRLSPADRQAVAAGTASPAAWRTS